MLYRAAELTRQLADDFEALSRTIIRRSRSVIHDLAVRKRTDKVELDRYRACTAFEGMTCRVREQLIDDQSEPPGALGGKRQRCAIKR